MGRLFPPEDDRVEREGQNWQYNKAANCWAFRQTSDFMRNCYAKLEVQINAAPRRTGRPGGNSTGFPRSSNKRLARALQGRHPTYPSGRNGRGPRIAS